MFPPLKETMSALATHDVSVTFTLYTHVCEGSDMTCMQSTDYITSFNNII